MAGNKDMFGFLGGDMKTKIFSIIIILIIIVLLFWGGKKLSNYIRSFKIAERMEIAELASQGVKVSYTDAQFKTYADTLERAMKGLGTDVNSVHNVFKLMKNRADVLKLIEKFGVRDGQDLRQWLDAEIMLYMKDINGILARNGIDYTF